VPVPGALGYKTEGPILCPLFPPRPLSVSAMLPIGGSLSADLGGPFGRTRRLVAHCALQLFSLSSGILAPLLSGVTTTMPTEKDPVWQYVTRMKGNRVKCNFCATEMYNNPTAIKKHVVKNCSAPVDVRNTISKKLHDGMRAHKGDDLVGATDGGDAAGWVKLSKSCGTTKNSQGDLLGFVQTLTHKEKEAIDTKCETWIYRSALPLQTTESSGFLEYSRALNLKYIPRSRFSIAGSMLKKVFKAHTVLVDVLVDKFVREGEVVVGGDAYTERLKNSIYDVVLFTADPCTWGPRCGARVGTRPPTRLHSQ